MNSKLYTGQIVKQSLVRQKQTTIEINYSNTNDVERGGMSINISDMC